ncbi:MAG: putative methyltransferase [Parcubacteria group bacterium ADurb.Bin192]|nr:MAG: putative methyltransferase [Parcubacteria group bacterium ADurb.Bin192]
MANNKVKKVNLTSSNLSEEKLHELRQILPEAFSEDKIDWDSLKTVLGDHIDPRIEKFGFTWAGKSNAIRNVLMPSGATLRPVKDASVDFDKTENLFIEGDNLEVLKLLQKAYFEKIKVIYIDPPYNTGSDFVYKDNFTAPVKGYLEQTGQITGEGQKLQTNKETNGRYHSDWLSMMYPRLKLAWNLLRDDGMIFVSIDDNEVHHLRLVMDEIFGEENYLNAFAWVNNLKGRQISGSGAAKTYEYVLAYAKKIEQVGIFEMSIEKLKSLMPSSYKGFNYEAESDEGGDFVVKNELYNTNSAFNEETRPNLVFNIHYNFKTKEVKFSEANDATSFPGFTKITPKKNNDGRHKYHAWRWSKEKIVNELSDLKFVETEDGARIYTKIRSYLSTALKDIITDITTTNGASDLKELFGGSKHFDYPKPIELIKIFVSQIESGIILDFFAGSGSTAHAVLSLNAEDKGNRKFILVQLPEAFDIHSDAYKAGYKTIADLAVDRIKRANKKLSGTGFKVFKLGESNYPENNFEFDPDKSEEENQKAFEAYLAKAKQSSLFDDGNSLDIVYENIIKEGLSLNSSVAEQKLGKNNVFTVTDGIRTLTICLDRKVEDQTVRELTGRDYKGHTFICLDNALNDTSKANLGLNLELKTI